MALSSGTRLNHFEILGHLGTGGMGEVYKARDTRLNRFVAIKVLPAHLAEQPELRERFKREAETIAKLNHPHICTLFDIGHQDGTDYLVMEYLEGETLSARLKKGPLQLDHVLRYAVEISDALDKAHRVGVTHRDIKPANVIVTREGTKLLDFGLAKLKQEVAKATLPASEMPTVAGELTEHGTLLGTLHYMAPEQVEGKLSEIDARTDIFAFGALVYEMATAKKAFPGDTQASVIAKIMEIEPPSMTVLQPMTPPALDRVVKKCLRKDPESRWQTARDITDELQWLTEGSAQATIAAPLPGRTKRRERLAWGIAALAFVVTFALGAVFFLRTPASPETMRFSVSTTGFSGSLSLSPDGRQMAFAARDSSGQSLLWVRQLDSLDARPLPGTERAYGPFWSPDSQFLGFFADGKLKRVGLSGGPVQTLADSPSGGRGAAWNSDGVIVFPPERRGGLSKVSSAGGVVSPITTLDPSRHETDHRWPQFLPDGRHFLYLVSTEQPQNSGIYVGSLDSKETKQLLNTEVGAAYSPPGYLLFIRNEALMAQPFDANRLELIGEPSAIAEELLNNRRSGRAEFSVSQSGVLAYINASVNNTQLVWFDRGGRQLGVVGPSARYQQTPELSPDGKQVAVALGPQGGEDLWLLDLGNGTTSRFTFDPARDNSPHWSPDGSHVIFRSNRRNDRYYDLYQKNASGSGDEELIFENPGPPILNPQDWSPDGRFLLDLVEMENTGFDLWVLPLQGERKHTPYLQAPANQSHAQFSPDGRWVAYASDESGRAEVYIQSFPSPGSKRQISTNGGEQPRWRADGKELFFLASDQKLMSAPVRVDPTGAGLEVGAATVLFQTGIAFLGISAPDPRQRYDVTADGQRFLLNIRGVESSSPITVVLNWTAALKK